MPADINFEDLTEDETRELAIKALEQLPLQVKIQVVLNGFENNELEELESSIQAAIGGDEEEEEAD
jgi:hypothetical protein